MGLDGILSGYSPHRSEYAITFFSFWKTCLPLTLIAYVSLCRALRYRAEHVMRKKLGYHDRASMAKMTNDEAQQIVQFIATGEFPYVYKLSLQFALFKTYGVPTISKLLVRTGAFTRKASAPKRYQDTSIIFGLFFFFPPTSDVSINAIARMNYLHSHHQAAGYISNDDLLYTLAAALIEPERYIRLYEWRPLNDMEICGLGTLWKGVGDAMKIDYAASLGEDKVCWKDGIEFFETIRTWAKEYEIKHMVPAETNPETAKNLVDMLLNMVPSFMKPFSFETLTVLMGDRIRDAFMYPEPGIAASLLAYLALNLRRMFVRYLCLPRFTPFQYYSKPDPHTGRIQSYDYLVEPWYLKGNIWNRWGPMALMTRLMGGMLPGDHDERFIPQGFLVEDLGPAHQMGKGQEAMKSNAVRVRCERELGCPFK